jgi:elongation factor P
MALGVTDLKKGTIFQFDNTPYRVVEYSQKVVGRGGSIVNVKIKSLVDGKVLEKTFKGNDTLQEADVTNANAQYLYNDGTVYYFMDQESFEQHEIQREILGDQAQFLKEGGNVQTQSFNGQVINVELPKNVYLEVTYCEDAVKGDTSSAITKDATLETGAKVKVPAFIKTGDIISVDTSTGAYRERKKD